MAIYLWPVRSAVFTITFFLYSGIAATFFIPCVFFPKSVLRGALSYWAKGTEWLMDVLMDINVSVLGIENLPKGSCIIVSGHGSAFDTIIWLRLVSLPSYVMKRELFLIPLYGQYSYLVGMVFHNRKGGTASVRNMMSDIEKRIARGMKVILFPQGTRVACGERGNVKNVRSVYSLYKKGIQVVPVWTNSANCWGRRAFLGKRAGEIIYRIYPPIAVGLSSKDFEIVASDFIVGTEVH
jgi:1-acyl-sn-glycerol-3-phosphate acyltransferase